MSETGAGGTQEPSPSELGRIADACARFEAAWRRGERPRIEADLAAAGPEAGSMLSRLLPLELSLRLDAGESPSPGEYLSRFPASRGLIKAAFADRTTVADATAAAPPRPKSGTNAASNLLIGILALQNGFVDHVALIAAIREWAADRSRDVATILAAGGKLDDRQTALLKALAEEHRRRHGDDLSRSLSAFGSLAPVMRAVEGMGDPEVEAGLRLEPESTVLDGEATTAHDPRTGDAPRPGPGPGPGGSASRFEVISFHNAGMLGKVFIALDRELNRNVALKEIQERHAHHPVSREQFVLEGMVTGALEHPGIVPVYSLGAREDGSPFYAMRFIQGPSLREKLKQLHGEADAPALAAEEEPPTLPRLLRHFVNACHAMAYAHSRGVLHRDLKPEHVLLGPFGETLVVDWGLAMPIRGGPAAAGAPLEFPSGRESSLAQDGVVVGTLPYMSPEQARGMQSRLDGRSDVYALGAILYALLTGRAPIAGGNFASMLDRARRGEFPRPREVSRQAPRPLEAVCLKAMAHDPDGRYATATELARDVERWLDDEPTVAYPEPIADRAGRWLRRHRTAAVAAVVAMACATVGLAALYHQAGRANIEIRRQWRRAEDARGEAVAAREKAERAGEQREANFRATLAAVNDYLRRVAMEDVPRTPGTTALRRDVAAATAKLLDTLWKQRPEDAEVRYMAGRAYREHANILRLLGRSNDGSYRRAFELLRGAVAALPAEPRFRDYLSETLKDAAGRHQLANRPAAAAPLLAEALELTARLRDEHPGEPNFARSEARDAAALAENLMLLGEFEDARARAERALALMKPLAGGGSPAGTDRLEVVAYLCVHGEALVGAGRPAEAGSALDEAVARAEAELAAKPGDSDLRLLGNYARIHRARAHAALGRVAEARAAVDAAAAGFEALAAEHAEVVHYRQNLADALILRAERHADSQALADARHDLERARELAEGLLREQPDNLTYTGLLGRAEGRLGLVGAAQGDPAEARPRLARAIALQRLPLAANPKSPQDLQALKEWEAALAALPPAAE